MAALLSSIGQDEQGLGSTASQDCTQAPTSSDSSLPHQPKVSGTSTARGDSSEQGVQSGFASLVSSGRLPRSLQLPLPWPLTSWRPSPPAPSPTLRGPSRDPDLPQQHDSPPLAEPSEGLAVARPDAAQADFPSLEAKTDESAVTHRPDQMVETTQAPDSAQAAQTAQASEPLDLPEMAQPVMSVQQPHGTGSELNPHNQSIEPGLLAAANMSPPPAFSAPGVANNASAPVLCQPLPEHIPENQVEHSAGKPGTGEAGETAEQAFQDLAALGGMKPEQKALWAKGLQLSRLVHQVISSHHALCRGMLWFAHHTSF